MDDNELIHSWIKCAGLSLIVTCVLGVTTMITNTQLEIAHLKYANISAVASNSLETK